VVFVIECNILVLIITVNENWWPVPKKPTILGKAYNKTGNKTMSRLVSVYGKHNNTMFRYPKPKPGTLVSQHIKRLVYNKSC